MSSSPSSPYLTCVETAEILRTGVMTVMRLCRTGELPATKPQKAWLIHRDDLDAYLAAASNRAAS